MDLRLAAYGLIVEDGRMLLAHWRERDRCAWTLPGGGIEAGEHPEDAAIREIQEETGFTVRLGDVLGVDSEVIPARLRIASGRGSLQAVKIIYRATVIAGQIRDETDGSTDRADWFALADVEALERVSMVDLAVRLHRDSASSPTTHDEETPRPKVDRAAETSAAECTNGSRVATTGSSPSPIHGSGRAALPRAG